MHKNKLINSELLKYRRRFLRLLYFRESLLGRLFSFLKGGEKPTIMINDLIKFRGGEMRK